MSGLVVGVSYKYRLILMNPYTKYFFKDIQDGSMQSAREIVPIIMEILHPRSVIDIGCGVGVWFSLVFVFASIRKLFLAK